MEEANTQLGFYSKIFCVPKPGVGKWRMIIDMRYVLKTAVQTMISFIFSKLNKYIKKKTFKMQGVKDVRSALIPGMYASVIDISDAYYQ